MTISNEAAAQQMAPQAAASERSAYAAAPKNDPLRKVSQDFESLLVNQVFQVMRKTVVRGEMPPESQAERVFQGMLDEKYAGQAASQRNLGLADMIYQQLLHAIPSR